MAARNCLDLVKILASPIQLVKDRWLREMHFVLDWDLKRDVAGKLEKLERRTQKAIAELIRDRLKEESSLADAVAEAENLARQEDDE